MTIPDTIIFPLHGDQIRSGDPEKLERYIVELLFTLKQMYETLAQGVNGDIRANFLQQNSRWTPTVKDTNDDTTTFNYDHQTGWVFRQGLLTDVWFDVEWTSVAGGTTTGDMYLELPYKVAVTNDMPFVGVLQPSVFTYTGGTESVINAISDTFRGEVWNTGSGFTTANQASVAAGRLIGHIRYIGVENG